jgi:hypothetical protein
MADPAPLHRSAEVEDLTHITELDKKRFIQDTEQNKSLLHRSEEMEDLAHLSTQEINRPLSKQQ